jgi:hypothetical protein
MVLNTGRIVPAIVLPGGFDIKWRSTSFATSDFRDHVRLLTADDAKCRQRCGTRKLVNKANGHNWPHRIGMSTSKNAQNESKNETQKLSCCKAIYTRH